MTGQTTIIVILSIIALEGVVTLLFLDNMQSLLSRILTELRKGRP